MSKSSLIGNGPDQVSTNSMLGSNAFRSDNLYYTEVYMAGSQTISGITEAVIQFDSIGRDVHGLWDTSNYEYTAPATGIYLINYHAEIVNVSITSTWAFPGNFWIKQNWDTSSWAVTTSDDHHLRNGVYNAYFSWKTFFLERGGNIRVTARCGTSSESFGIQGHSDGRNTRLSILYMGRDDNGL
jgi:hypothetical protein